MGSRSSNNSPTIGPSCSRLCSIAAQVPGVTYDGSGRFLVAAQERQIVATIRRAHTGMPGVRREGGDSAVLEIPTGLGDGELAAAAIAALV